MTIRAVVAAAALLIALASELGAQGVVMRFRRPAAVPSAGSPARLTSTAAATRGDSTARARAARFRTRFVLGAISSILAHEAGHVIASYALGAHPSFGFSKYRPTIYSGIDATADPHKQFIFSSAGLTTQALLNEAILDIPHARGGAFERGLLAGGIGTALFYITIGRNGTVSDVAFMARTSSLSKDQVSLIYGGIAVLQVVRIKLNRRYAHFFSAPAEAGGLKVGIEVRPRA